MRAGKAEPLTGDLFESSEVNSLSATGTRNAVGLISRQLGGLDGNSNAFQAEQLIVAKFAVRQHLLMALVFDLRMQLASKITRILEGDDANSGVSGEIDEGSGHLPPVSKFERAFAQPAAGDHPNGIGGATVNLNVGCKPLAVGTQRIFDAQGVKSEERHAHAEYLAGAHVSVRDLRFLQKSLEGFVHRLSDWRNRRWRASPE